MKDALGVTLEKSCHLRNFNHGYSILYDGEWLHL